MSQQKSLHAPAILGRWWCFPKELEASQRVIHIFEQARLMAVVVENPRSQGWRSAGAEGWGVSVIVWVCPFRPVRVGQELSHSLEMSACNHHHHHHPLLQGLQPNHHHPLL